MPRSPSRRPGPPPGQVFVASPLLLLLLLLAWCAGACGGKTAPKLPGTRRGPATRASPRLSIADPAARSLLVPLLSFSFGF